MGDISGDRPVNPVKKHHVLAAYLRLSLADGDLGAGKGESNSISNQRMLIQDYQNSHPDLAAMEYTEYLDDGYTGTTTARPSFQMMMQKVRAGKIDCIVVKDMSRLSRDYITLGDYVEQIFPLLGIRFIAINDGYDSKEQYAYLQSMSLALQGLFYSYYSRDLSKKHLASSVERMKNGRLPNHCPFGYRINREKYRYEIDPEAARIVRLIFDFVLSGQDMNTIVNTLNELEIPTPNIYNRLHPELAKPIHPTKRNLWIKEQVKGIIQNPVYIGTLVTHKSYSSIAERVRNASVPEEEHIVHENFHDPIIPREDFEKACLLIQEHPNQNQKGRSKKKQDPFSPLSGAIHCGHCGVAMHYEPHRHTMKCRYHYLEHSDCSFDEYPLAVLEDFIFFELRFILEQAVREKTEQEKAVRQAKRELKDCQRQISALQSRLDEVTREKRTLFESFTSNNIMQPEFSAQMEQLKLASDTIQSKMLRLENTASDLSAVTVSQEILSLSEKAVLYLEEGHLTRDMVTDYVKDLTIYGQNDYRITWRYPRLFGSLQQKARGGGILETEDGTDPEAGN